MSRPATATRRSPRPRRFARVTSTDYVPDLLEQGRRRAEADGLDISFQVADAEALPFEDDSFDVALSTFGERQQYVTEPSTHTKKKKRGVGGAPLRTSLTAAVYRA